jgi:hypothetical protein
MLHLGKTHLNKDPLFNIKYTNKMRRIRQKFSKRKRGVGGRPVTFKKKKEISTLFGNFTFEVNTGVQKRKSKTKDLIPLSYFLR